MEAQGGAPSRRDRLFSVTAGGFGVDFSQATEDVGSGVALVAQRILSHGVTSFCPTLVTSPPEVYHKVRSGARPQAKGAREVASSLIFRCRLLSPQCPWALGSGLSR